MFSCGCGRLFEGTPEQMHDSLEKIQNLPDDTLVYCAHEYTLDNIGFAKIVDPLNDLLIEKEKKVIELRDQNIPTVPSILKEEKLIKKFPLLSKRINKLEDEIAKIKVEQVKLRGKK